MPTLKGFTMKAYTVYNLYDNGQMVKRFTTGTMTFDQIHILTMNLDIEAVNSGAEYTVVFDEE